MISFFAPWALQLTSHLPLDICDICHTRFGIVWHHTHKYSTLSIFVILLYIIRGNSPKIYEKNKHLRFSILPSFLSYSVQSNN